MLLLKHRYKYTYSSPKKQAPKRKNLTLGLLILGLFQTTLQTDGNFSINNNRASTSIGPHDSEGQLHKINLVARADCSSRRCPTIFVRSRKWSMEQIHLFLFWKLLSAFFNFLLFRRHLALQFLYVFGSRQLFRLYPSLSEHGANTCIILNMLFCYRRFAVQIFIFYIIVRHFRSKILRCYSKSGKKIC